MKILLLAGEESGLIYAERLKKRLASLCDSDAIEFRSYQTEGFKTGDLAVMGFWPVLKKIFYFLGVAKTMKEVIRSWSPDVVVTIDYPGLNLKLAAYAKGLGIPAVHMVCPQVWAWHQGRIPRVAAALTKLLCFFPFEPALFKGTTLDAKFIGHPMVDVFAEEAVSPTLWNGSGVSDGTKVDGDLCKPVLALLPGSRVGEIKRNLPRLLAAVELFGEDLKRLLEIVVPAANVSAKEEIVRLCMRSNVRNLVTVQQGDARKLLRRSTCAAVASGTATLEAALARCPTVLVYAVSPILAWFARRVIKGVRHIGLANVIWEKSGGTGEPPMVELLQEAFTPEAVAEHLVPLLSDAAARAAVIRCLDEAMALLHSGGDAIGLAAREILNEIRK